MKEISLLRAEATEESRASELGNPDMGKRPLTAREREILSLLAAGLGTPAIARRLSISTATVRNHVQRLLAKLRVHSRLAAVARAYATGLLSPAASGEEDVGSPKPEKPPS